MVYLRRLVHRGIVGMYLVFIGVASASAAPFAYVPNQSQSGYVSVIDTATNTVTATVPAVGSPFYGNGVAVNPAGTRVYVASGGFNAPRLRVIDTSTNTVTSEIPLGYNEVPYGLAVNPAGNRLYAALYGANRLAVIDTATNTIIARIPAGAQPRAVAVNPGGTRVYVTHTLSFSVDPFGPHGYVSVIDTATNLVIAQVRTAEYHMYSPPGVAVSPDGTRVYVANDSDVSLIDTSTYAVIARLPMQNSPFWVAANPIRPDVYITVRKRRGQVSTINSREENIGSHHRLLFFTETEKYSDFRGGA